MQDADSWGWQAGVLEGFTRKREVEGRKEGINVVCLRIEPLKKVFIVESDAYKIPSNLSDTLGAIINSESIICNAEPNSKSEIGLNIKSKKQAQLFFWQTGRWWIDWK